MTGGCIYQSILSQKWSHLCCALAPSGVDQCFGNAQWFKKSHTRSTFGEPLFLLTLFAFIIIRRHLFLFQATRLIEKRIAHRQK